MFARLLKPAAVGTFGPLRSTRTALRFAPTLTSPRRAFSNGNKSIDRWSGFNEAGVIYMQQGELDKAETMFRACLALEQERDPALNPSNAPFLSLSFANLGMVFRRRQKPEDAKQVLRQAVTNLNRFPTRVDMHIIANIHRELASVYEMEGDHVSATEELQKALELYSLPREEDSEAATRARSDKAMCTFALGLSRFRTLHGAPSSSSSSAAAAAAEYSTVVETLQQARDLVSAAFGAEHPNLATVLHSLGTAQFTAACTEHFDSEEYMNLAKQSYFSGMSIYKDKGLNDQFSVVLQDYMAVVDNETKDDPVAKKMVADLLLKSDDDVDRAEEVINP